MALPAGQGRVEHADVEDVRLGRRIGEDKVLGDGRRREALAMDRDREVGEPVGLGPP